MNASAEWHMPRSDLRPHPYPSPQGEGTTARETLTPAERVLRSPHARSAT
jgi:hypothetical protein